MYSEKKLFLFLNMQNIENTAYIVHALFYAFLFKTDLVVDYKVIYSDASLEYFDVQLSLKPFT